ncbi:hypothetical protein PCE1_000056 [Barthelona sp. PCE]
MEDSRIFISGLPKYFKERDVRAAFEEFGEITDLALIRTKTGLSRRIAFIGYKESSHAQAAIQTRDGTFLDTSKINVSFALEEGNKDIARPWSKYSEGSSAYRETQATEQEKPVEALPEEVIAERKRTAAERRMQWMTLMNGGVEPPQPDDDEDVEGYEKKKQRNLGIIDEEDDEMDNQVFVLDSDSEYEADPKGEISSEESEIEENEEQQEVIESKEPEKKTIEEPMKERAPLIEETTRVRVVNVPYSITKSEAERFFDKYGDVMSVIIPIHKLTRKPRGFIFVEFSEVHEAKRCIERLDGQLFQGRRVHVEFAKAAAMSEQEAKTQAMKKSLGDSSFKRKKLMKMKELADKQFNWNSFFIRMDSALENAAKTLNVSTSELMLNNKMSMAVTAAIAETTEIQNTKTFLEKHNVNVLAFEHAFEMRRRARQNGLASSIRNDRFTVIVRNLPSDVDERSLRMKFGKGTPIAKFVLTPNKSMLLLQYSDRADARKIFTKNAYSSFKGQPIYMEYAPLGIWEKVKVTAPMATEKAESTTLFVGNLSWKTDEKTLTRLFSDYAVRTITMPAGKPFAFVEFPSVQMGRRAKQAFENMVVDGKRISIDFAGDGKSKAAAPVGGSTKTKLIVRNVAFQATKEELMSLFSSYGEVKALRLPRKNDGSGRGYCFVEFLTHDEANDALAKLSHTHFYGRSLVTEWADDQSALEEAQRKASRYE